MSGKTGRYRVRKGWFGRSILQFEIDGPAFTGGHVDASTRVRYWNDVLYDNAPAQLRDASNEYTVGEKNNG